MTALITVLGNFLYYFFLMIMGSLLSGYTLSVLWGWFVVPIFGTPYLSVVAAIGVIIVTGFLVHRVSDSELEEAHRDIGAEEEYQRKLHRISYTIVRPLFTLLFGYIVHLFM